MILFIMTLSAAYLVEFICEYSVILRYFTCVTVYNLIITIMRPTMTVLDITRKNKKLISKTVLALLFSTLNFIKTFILGIKI